MRTFEGDVLRLAVSPCSTSASTPQLSTWAYFGRRQHEQRQAATVASTGLYVGCWCSWNCAGDGGDFATELGEFRALSKEAAESLGTERGQPGEEALKIRKAVLDSLYALDMFVYKREYNGIGEALKGDFGVDRVIVDITAPLKDLDSAAAAYDKFLAAVSM